MIFEFLFLYSIERAALSLLYFLCSGVWSTLYKPVCLLLVNWDDIVKKGTFTEHGDRNLLSSKLMHVELFHETILRFLNYYCPWISYLFMFAKFGYNRFWYVEDKPWCQRWVSCRATDSYLDFWICTALTKQLWAQLYLLHTGIWSIFCNKLISFHYTTEMRTFALLGIGYGY